MNRKLLFGCAYYLEYMPYDRLDEDLDMMKAAGMNVIRIAESTWSTLEPSDGVFDFSYIDRMLDAAKKWDMMVIIGTPTYAIPSWMEKKDANVMMTGKEGQAPYGHRQIMNIFSDTYRYHCERVIRKLMEHTAPYEHVIGFQLDNETKHYGNFGFEIQEQFKEYLKETYQTTDAFNKAFYLSYWSNSIHDWDDLPDMKGCINGGLASEFEKFKRSMAAEFLQWQSDIVREYKREDQFITHNLDFEWKKFGADIAQDGYSYGVQPDINHYEASKALTLVGTDIYHPTQDDLTGAEIAFGGDEIRSLKGDNYLVLECQAQAFKYWTPYPEQLRLQAYSHLASGADGVMYWNWHSIHNGYETYWRGLLSHDLATNPTYEEACEFGKEWENLGDTLAHLKKKNQIAMVIDTHSLHAMKWFPVDRDLSYNDMVRWMYDSLYEMNLECDVVDVHALDVNQYKMIITPGLYSASEETIEALKGFVKNGGVLISSFRSFVSDEHLSVYPDAQPHKMTDCFGMSYQQFTDPGKIRLMGEPVTYFAELLTPTTGKAEASYEHKYWGAYAGITHNAYGDGMAYYVGCFTTKDILKKIYEKAAKDAGIAPVSLQWPCILRSGETTKGTQIHYLLHYSEEENEVKCPYPCVKDILTGEIYEEGMLISLKDWDVKILEEQ